jgi:hypothetical protein
VFGIALLGAIVTAAFERDFLARLISSGMPSPQAHLTVSSAGSAAATGGTTAAGIASGRVGDAIKQSFVHAMHAGIVVAIAFMVIAGVVSAIFVRSHVTPHGEAFEGGAA